jgi:hypothetical protein
MLFFAGCTSHGARAWAARARCLEPPRTKIGSPNYASAEAHASRPVVRAISVRDAGIPGIGRAAPAVVRAGTVLPLAAEVAGAALRATDEAAVQIFRASAAGLTAQASEAATRVGAARETSHARVANVSGGAVPVTGAIAEGNAPSATVSRHREQWEDTVDRGLARSAHVLHTPEALGTIGVGLTLAARAILFDAQDIVLAGSRPATASARHRGTGERSGARITGGPERESLVASRRARPAAHSRTASGAIPGPTLAKDLTLGHAL